jgi:hypothetical protein
VAVDPLGSPREVNGHGEEWLVEDLTAMQGKVRPGDAEGREAGVDLATVRVFAHAEPETKRVLKAMKPPRAASVFQN